MTIAHLSLSLFPCSSLHWSFRCLGCEVPAWGTNAIGAFPAKMRSICTSWCTFIEPCEFDYTTTTCGVQLTLKGPKSGRVNRSYAGRGMNEMKFVPMHPPIFCLVWPCFCCCHKYHPGRLVTMDLTPMDKIQLKLGFWPVSQTQHDWIKFHLQQPFHWTFCVMLCVVYCYRCVCNCVLCVVCCVLCVACVVC